MKVFVFLAIVALACADEEWHTKTPEEMKTIRSECIAAHPLSAEHLAQMKNFEFPDEEPVRKFLLCTVTKLEIFCTQNGYLPERVAQSLKFDLDLAEALAIAQSCVDDNAAGSPADIWAFRGHSCVMASKLGEKLKTHIKNKIQAEKH